jgi:tRNA-splicing ligase RtcB (3'-phosphate/5'-hydroxy nucleic acid ligase)
MTYCTINGANVPIRMWANPHEVEAEALKQLKSMASLPWVAHHVAVMPDVHVGKGATVGSVLALRDAIAPAAVGVDIGCGMAAVETDLTAGQLPDSLLELRLAIEAAIPVGRAARRTDDTTTLGAATRERVAALLGRFGDLRAPAARLRSRAEQQLGSLGGGNHFIEVCIDTAQKVWLLLHSGSRNIGASLAEHHMLVAQRLQHNQALHDRDLGVFLADTPQFAAYRHDLYWAQEYAALNRDVMMEYLQQVMQKFFPRVKFGINVKCHHNYVAEEQHFGEFLMITRKGAIRARAGELGIIPGSMGAKSYIVRGLGNPLAFESASHGAGRRMSRGQARRTFRLSDLVWQTDGVECRKDHGVLDEAPKAYKNIDRVMAAQADLVEVYAELKQVVCVKG